MVITADDPRFEDDGLYMRCGNEYALRFAELQDAVARAEQSINERKLESQIVAAAEALNDLDMLQRLQRGAFVVNVV